MSYARVSVCREESDDACTPVSVRQPGGVSGIGTIEFPAGRNVVFDFDAQYPVLEFLLQDIASRHR